MNHASQSSRNGHTGPASDALRDLTKHVIDESVKGNPKLTPAQAAQIAAAANAIRILLGTIAPSSGIPAAEASLFDLISTIDGLGSSGGDSRRPAEQGQRRRRPLR